MLKSFAIYNLTLKIEYLSNWKGASLCRTPSHKKSSEANAHT
jgi:hypothetical protein